MVDVQHTLTDHAQKVDHNSRFCTNSLSRIYLKNKAVQDYHR